MTRSPTSPGPGPSRSHAGRLLLAVACASAVLAGCRTPDGPYVWADRYEEPHAGGPYLISPGDMLHVRVFNQEGMSGTARVRPDGMISLPFLNDVEAAGETPAVLAQRLQVRLKDFLVNPVVTVSLDETRPLEVSVVGEVQRAGLYRLEQGAGVMTALAAASGLNDYADRSRIFVIRNGTQRIRFTYAAMTQALEKAARFRLRPGDIVVVE